LSRSTEDPEAAPVMSGPKVTWLKPISQQPGGRLSTTACRPPPVNHRPSTTASRRPAEPSAGAHRQPAVPGSLQYLLARQRGRCSSSAKCCIPGRTGRRTAGHHHDGGEQHAATCSRPARGGSPGRAHRADRTAALQAARPVHRGLRERRRHSVGAGTPCGRHPPDDPLQHVGSPARSPVCVTSARFWGYPATGGWHTLSPMDSQLSRRISAVMTAPIGLSEWPS
jgi:hypothetical protein